MATAGELKRHAEAYGYDVQAYEKAVRLLGITDALAADPYLRDQFALKGGCGGGGRMVRRTQCT